MSFSCASGAVGSKKQPGLLGAPGFPPEKAHPVCLRCSKLNFIHTKELEWTWMLTFVWEVVSGIWLNVLMLADVMISSWFHYIFQSISLTFSRMRMWRNIKQTWKINEWILLCILDHFRSPPRARCGEPFLATLIPNNDSQQTFKLLGRPRQYLANHGGH